MDETAGYRLLQFPVCPTGVLLCGLVLRLIIRSAAVRVQRGAGH